MWFCALVFFGSRWIYFILILLLIYQLIIAGCHNRLLDAQRINPNTNDATYFMKVKQIAKVCLPFAWTAFPKEFYLWFIWLIMIYVVILVDDVDSICLHCSVDQTKYLRTGQQSSCSGY